jgi:large subunit ribosomal protein L17
MVNKLFTDLAERYKERPGGFTRVLQIGQRKSDSASMAYIEYVDRDGELRPARPATGFGLSWAAKEYVNSQLASRKRHGDVRAVLSPGADAAAKALAEPPKEEKK